MHPHDEKWVTEQLQLLPHSMRGGVMAKYALVHTEVLARFSGKICAESEARREANTRLREYIAKYTSTYRGNTITPPRVK
jgi:hypothetical protein